MPHDLRSNLACKIAIEAVNTVRMEENGRVEIDIKRYAKVEKVIIYKGTKLRITFMVDL